MTSNGPAAANPIAVEERPAISSAVRVAVPRDPPRRSSSWTVLGLVDDAALLLLVVILLPLVIILAGAPIALLVRIVREIARRF